jgi:hypothetical protein
MNAYETLRTGRTDGWLGGRCAPAFNSMLTMVTGASALTAAYCALSFPSMPSAAGRASVIDYYCNDM